MENPARKKWDAFRRYRFPGVKVTEDGTSIRFEQKNAFSRGRFILWLIALIVIMLWPILDLANSGPLQASIGFAVFAWLVYAPVIAPILLFKWVRMRTVVTAEGGGVTIKRGDEDPISIAIEDIQGCDVRQSDQFYVTVWDSPVPINTLSARNAEDATALREGLMAAMELMDAPQIIMGTPRRREFEE